MKYLRMRGMHATYEVGVTVGMTYLVFYLANGPLGLSGPIAVVVYGLHGSATLNWDMSSKACAGAFQSFWDIFSQVCPYHRSLSTCLPAGNN